LFSLMVIGRRSARPELSRAEESIPLESLRHPVDEVRAVDFRVRVSTRAEHLEYLMHRVDGSLRRQKRLALLAGKLPFVEERG
jgi:hypothetical protein